MFVAKATNITTELRRYEITCVETVCYKPLWMKGFIFLRVLNLIIKEWLALCTFQCTDKVVLCLAPVKTFKKILLNVLTGG